MGFTINAEGTQRIIAIVITVITTIITEIILIRGLKGFSIIVERKSTEKMNKEKTRKKLGLAFMVLATLLMVLLNSLLLYTCINLYRMDCKEDFACMIIGVVFIGLILGFLYIILITWKEFKEEGLLK